MRKFNRFLLIFLAVFLAWFPVLFFWFGNVDLSYLKSYLNLANPVGDLNFLNVIRGHVLLQMLAYLLFGLRPFGYYLVAVILHSLAVSVVFIFLQRLFDKSKTNFLLALLFGVNVAYADVLFEGSFNAYYPLLLILIILSTLPFQGFLKGKVSAKLNIGRLVVPSFLMAAGFLFRETTLLIPLIIFLIIIIYCLNFKKDLRVLIYLVLPFVLSVIYLFLRTRFLGELKSDLTDDAVQARLAFISSRRFFEWFSLSMINFLRMFSEQIFFPVRLLSQNISLTVISGVLGLGTIIAVGWRVAKRGEKKVSAIVQFGLGWVIVVNLFVSLILPFPLAAIAAKYEIGATLSRYNYWGIFGLVIVLGAVLTAWPKFAKKIRVGIVLFLVLNFLLIQIGGWKLYLKKHLPAKNFYKTVLSTYPNFPQETLIYYNFFQINNLRDYVGDLVWIFADKYYPNVHFGLDTSLSYVQKEYFGKKIPVEAIFAFDLDKNGALVDKTSEVRKTLLALKSIPLEPKLSPKVPEDVYANFSYFLEFSLRTKMSSKSKSALCKGGFKTFSDKETGELMNYYAKRIDFLKTAKVNASSNYGDYPRFYFISANNLIDGQFGRESSWQANIGDKAQSVVLDLGKKQRISGVAWNSEGISALPSAYTIYISGDGVVWLKTDVVASNADVSKIDRFEKAHDARYVKIQVDSTSLGQPVRLTEIEALDYSDYLLENYYKWDDLIKDANNMFCNLAPNKIMTSSQPGEILWTTDKGTVGRWNLDFYLDSRWRKYVVPVTNLEIYSNSLAILDEKLKSVEIVPGRLNLDYEIKDVKLVPMEK